MPPWVRVAVYNAHMAYHAVAIHIHVHIAAVTAVVIVLCSTIISPVIIADVCGGVRVSITFNTNTKISHNIPVIAVIS